MRITQQLLRSRSAGPLQCVEYIDLSNLGIASIERVNSCPKLQRLNLRGNCLVEVTNLEYNRHLWNLDLSNNQIKDLDCLSKFIALGSLNLANNDLSWQDVGKLRQVHILELSLHGNKQLEKDPYYRIHLIDCLPYVWMLDGRIITSAERLQVKHFFADSALTDHPIRRKLSKEWFVPSALKKIEINGVYGEKATHLMMRFPTNGASNIETDRRRLKYLAHNAQEDLMLEKKYTRRDFQVLKYKKTFIEDILDARAGDRERCNMLLLLLVSTLEFVMPTHLVKETLEVAKLSKIGKVYTMDLFLLPKDIRCRIVCVLLGAVKIDKDVKEDGGLYDKLYLCLFYTVAELSKLSNSIFGKNVTPKMKITQLYRDYKCLLASEVVQLLCIVPAFFEYIDKDSDMPGASGVMNLVVTATGDSMITEKVVKLSQNIQLAGGDLKKLYEELSDFLLQKVQEQSLDLTNKAQKLPQEDQAITTTKAIPMKGSHSPLVAADFHAKGVTSPNLDPPTVLSARSVAMKSRKHFPHLGDYLLLGPQTLGKVIGLPQPFLAHVAMDSIPVANGAMESKLRQSEDHYTYVNMDQLDWDTELGFWKPRGSIGDSMLEEFLTYSNVLSRFTIHTIEDLRKELNRRANVSSDHMPRPNSPEEGTTRSFCMTPGRESTPLIFSPGGLQSALDSYSPRRVKTPHSDFSPRPMTSLLKEKLDLKLDFNGRRAQSASVLERTMRSPRSPSSSPDSKSVRSIDSRSVPPEPDDNLSVPTDGVSRSESVSTECVHCAIEAATNGQEQPVADSSHVNESSTPQSVVAKPSTEPSVPTAQTDSNANAESEKENNPPVIDKPTDDQSGTVDSTSNQQETSPPAPSQSEPTSTIHAETDAGTVQTEPSTSRTEPDSIAQSDDEEPELQGLTDRTERPASAPMISITTDLTPGREQESQGAAHDVGANRKTNSSLQINIPQVEIMEEEKGTPRGRAPVIKGRQPMASERKSFKNGRVAGSTRNRPFSAMDAYRYIVNHPRRPRGTDNLYNTSYQQQRMEAWRNSASATSATSQTRNVASSCYQGHIARQGTPPPQRPTSPDNKPRPTSSLSVLRGNDWLGGGRDLYFESIQKRPRSGHVPGWKEGLPDSMKRPRSAVAARMLNRHSRHSAPVTPSSLAYEAMMQGGRITSPRGVSYDLPGMMELSEYQPLHQQSAGSPRRLGSAGSARGSQEFYGQSTHDMVYRMPQVSPTLPTIASSLDINHHIYDAMDRESIITSSMRNHIDYPLRIWDNSSQLRHGNDAGKGEHSELTQENVAQFDRNNAVNRVLVPNMLYAGVHRI